jgi:hypothetical protein
MSDAASSSTSVEPGNRKLVRKALRILMICCLVVAFLSSYSHQQNADSERVSFQLGLPFSPLFDYTPALARLEEASSANVPNSTATCTPPAARPTRRHARALRDPPAVLLLRPPVWRRAVVGQQALRPGHPSPHREAAAGQSGRYCLPRCLLGRPASRPATSCRRCSGRDSFPSRFRPRSKFTIASARTRCGPAATACRCSGRGNDGSHTLPV